MLTYFKIMPVPAEGLHGPPGARLKSAKGWGCHRVEIMLSYFDLCWFDYFWKALCPANQGRFKILCLSFFKIIQAWSWKHQGLDGSCWNDNEPMLFRVVVMPALNNVHYYQYVRLRLGKPQMSPKKRPGDAGNALPLKQHNLHHWACCLSWFWCVLYACRYAWPICVLLGSMVCWAVSNPCRCQPMASQHPSRGHLEPANGSRGRYVWIMISFLGACWIVTGHMLGPLWRQIRPFGNNFRALLDYLSFVGPSIGTISVTQVNQVNAMMP